VDPEGHRSVDYRKKALPLWMLRDLLRSEKAKIYRSFEAVFPPRPDWRVLEVGTNASRSEKRDYFLHYHDPYPEMITAAGLEGPEIFERVFPQCAYVQVKRHEPLPFGAQSFDLVFSNAVVEHVGTRKQQKDFLEEILRVGKRAFVTTPNRWYPVEFHTVTPLFHYLPPNVYRRIYAALGFEFLAKAENLNLLDEREFLELLPEHARCRAELRYHRFLGLPSNLLLVVR
jgi:SAM-dependent methyltransferase